MMRRAKAVTQAIIDGSRYFPAGARNEAVKFALRSEPAPRLAAMIELAKSEDGVALPYSRFDADPWLVGVERGAVDLRTGTFLVPLANAYLSRRLGTEYNPHARCPTWCAFLDRITAGDISLIEFLQRAIGYTLTGNADEQVVFVLHGPGANGKSVLLRVIRELAGEYGADAAIETFVDRGAPGVVQRSRPARAPAVRLRLRTRRGAPARRIADQGSHRWRGDLGALPLRRILRI